MVFSPTDNIGGSACCGCLFALLLVPLAWLTLLGVSFATLLSPGSAGSF